MKLIVNPVAVLVDSLLQVICRMPPELLPLVVLYIAVACFLPL